MRPLRLVSALFLTLPLVVTSAGASCRDELSPRVWAGDRQSLQKRIAKNDFFVGRGLLKNPQSAQESYEDWFGRDFIRRLKSLSRSDTYIDFGAGAGYAVFELIDLFQGREAPKTVAINYRTPNEYKAAFDDVKNRQGLKSHRLITGQALEKLDPDEIRRTASVATDFFGPFSYSEEVSIVLTRELESLKTGGRLYLVFDSTRTHFRTEIGHVVTARQLFNSIDGVRLVSMKSDSSEHLSVVLERKRGPVLTPSLTLVKLTDGAPPYRTFQVSND